MSVDTLTTEYLSQICANGYEALQQVWRRGCSSYVNLPFDERMEAFDCFLMKPWSDPDSKSALMVCEVLMTLEKGTGYGRFTSVDAAKGAVYRSAKNACNDLYDKYTVREKVSSELVPESDAPEQEVRNKPEQGTCHTSRFAEIDPEIMQAKDETVLAVEEHMLEHSAQCLYVRIIGLNDRQRREVVSACLLAGGYKLAELKPVFPVDLGTIQRWGQRGAAWLRDVFGEQDLHWLDGARLEMGQREVMRRLFRRVDTLVHSAEPV